MSRWRVYDDIGQVVDVVYNPDTNTCDLIPKAPWHVRGKTIRLYLTAGYCIVSKPDEDSNLRQQSVRRHS
jgi:hypothetical protein